MRYSLNDFILAVFVCLMTVLLSACGSQGLYSVTMITEGQHTLPQNLEGDLIVLGGDVLLPQGAILNGSAHILLGSLTIKGEIVGDVSFLNGKLHLEPEARVGGSLNLGSQAYQLSPSAVVRGKINTGSGVTLPNLPEQRALDGGVQLVRSLIGGLLLALAAAGMGQAFPQALIKTGEAAVHHSLVSGSVGLLVGVVGISLLVTMAYTILLIPVTIFGLVLIGAAVLYGWVGMGMWLGMRLAKLNKRLTNPSAAAFWGTLSFVLVEGMLTGLPVVGGLLGIGLALVGLGAVSLTRFGVQQFVPQSQTNLVSWADDTA